MTLLDQFLDQSTRRADFSLEPFLIRGLCPFCPEQRLKIGRSRCWGSSRGRLKPFRETLARFCDEDKKFALGDPHYVDILMRCLESH